MEYSAQYIRTAGLHIKTGVSCTETEGQSTPVSWRVRAQQQTPNSSHTS
jgi:hypothetical protein